MVAEVSFPAGTLSSSYTTLATVSLYPDASAGSVVVDWGDGSAAETLSFDGTNSPLSVTHTFARGEWVTTATVGPNVTSQTVQVR